MANFKSVLRSEFRLKHFGFADIVYDRIFFSQWRIPPILIILYKLLLTVYVDTWLVLTANEADPNPTMNENPWSAYLTNWTYTFLAIHLNLSTAAIIVYHLLRTRHNKSWLITRNPGEHWSFMHIETSMGKPPDTALVHSRWFVAVPWILHSVACGAVPAVTILYFSFLYRGPGIRADDLQLHGLNTVCILIDFALNAVPVRLLHVIYPVCYGLIYIIFSAIYWAGDHSRVIYPNVLDWNEPGKTVGIMFGVIAILLVIQLIFFGTSNLKSFIYYKLYFSDGYESIPCRPT